MKQFKAFTFLLDSAYVGYNLEIQKRRELLPYKVVQRVFHDLENVHIQMGTLLIQKHFPQIIIEI